MLPTVDGPWLVFSDLPSTLCVYARKVVRLEALVDAEQDSGDNLDKGERALNSQHGNM